MVKMIRLQDSALIVENCKKCHFHAVRSSLQDYTVEGYCELTGSQTDRKTYQDKVLPDCRLEDYKIVGAERETSKIVRRKCQDCGEELEILCNASAQIVAIRCPKCTKQFHLDNPEGCMKNGTVIKANLCFKNGNDNIGGKNEKK